MWALAFIILQSRYTHMKASIEKVTFNSQLSLKSYNYSNNNKQLKFKFSQENFVFGFKKEFDLFDSILFCCYFWIVNFDCWV